MDTTEAPVSYADPKSLEEFMKSMQRLFKIGVYYPDGHSILDQATNRFIEKLEAVAGDTPFVKVEDHQDSLMVDDVVLEADTAFVQELKGILAILGLASFTFHRHMTAAEARDFVRKILLFKTNARTANQFTKIDFSNLPHSVTVGRKYYVSSGVSTDGEDSEDIGDDPLLSCISSLEDCGLKPDEVRQCTELLRPLIDNLQDSDSQFQLFHLPRATWDDIARLFARVVEKGQPQQSSFASPLSNINALASILEKVEDEAEDKKTQQALTLLLSKIQRRDEPLVDQADRNYRVNDRLIDYSHFHIKQIQEFIDNNAFKASTLNLLAKTPYTSDTLSILMQLSQHLQTSQQDIRIQQIYREILAGELSEKMWKTLSCGLHDCICQKEHSGITRIYTYLFEPLRRLPSGAGLRLCSLTLVLCNAEEKRMFWPYLVNELLAEGSSGAPLIYSELCHFAASISIQEMYTGLSVLQTLDAYENRSIAADICDDMGYSSYPLFAFLMQTDIEREICDRVVENLMKSPPDWLTMAITPLLDLARDEHREFLSSYLRLTSLESIPDTLKELSTDILLEGLPSLPFEKRKESWVQHGISGLSHLPSPRIRKLLEQIATKKKMLIVPEWPLECRKAADQALTKGRMRR